MTTDDDDLTAIELDTIANVMETALGDPGFIDVTSGGGLPADEADELRSDMIRIQAKVMKLARSRRASTGSAGWGQMPGD